MAVDEGLLALVSLRLSVSLSLAISAAWRGTVGVASCSPLITKSLKRHLWGQVSRVGVPSAPAAEVVELVPRQVLLKALHACRFVESQDCPRRRQHHCLGGGTTGR